MNSNDMTVADILIEVKEEMCDPYCKWPETLDTLAKLKGTENGSNEIEQTAG